jgi:hypothetical protein
MPNVISAGHFRRPHPGAVMIQVHELTKRYGAKTAVDHVVRGIT